MSSRIEDYALIGDCETAALVARNGSIDWLCFPRFDSGACFAALLGTPDNGRWRIAPAEPARAIRRRYREKTLILETEYETEKGVVTLIDWMPPRMTFNASNLMRLVVGKSGQVAMQMELIVRYDYGSVIPWVHRVQGGIRATAGPDSLIFLSGIELRGEDFRTTAQFAVSAGQRVPFQLVCFRTYEALPPETEVEQSLRETEEWWRKWCDRCSYRGEWEEAVIRSLITLKALTYAPTGGLVAAATTSLPERLGGPRNWDYRYCWLRDATFTIYALALSGYIEEAQMWREWLVNAAAGVPSEMQIMYGLAGERRLTELEVDWLPGYEGSRPVRTGNAAHDQTQLDMYGELMDSIYVAERAGLPPNENAWRLQLALLDYLKKAWQKPDHGIWEVRGCSRHFTHSKIMAWVAMDRAVKSVEAFGRSGPVNDWVRIRQEIHDQVCSHGFDPQINSFVQYYGAKHVDASLLMIPLVGFLPASDPRVLGTVQAIQERLTRDGLIDRYPTMPEVDGLPAGEGSFLMCTFWLADNLALQGRYEQAQLIFERLLELRNDVGLLSEEYDPVAHRLLGNFPQAFSHVGLVNTARNLTRAGGPAEHRQGL